MPNIIFCHSKSYSDIWIPIIEIQSEAAYRIWHSKSYSEIRIKAKYPIMTFGILF